MGATTSISVGGTATDAGTFRALRHTMHVQEVRYQSTAM